MDIYNQVDKDYDEHRMRDALETNFKTGRMVEMDNGGYAPLNVDRLEKDSVEKTIKKEGGETYKPLIDVRNTLAHRSNQELVEIFNKYYKDVKHPLQTVFDAVLDQVTKGKGEERHGNGKEFMEQPWIHLCDVHGVGFATGQCQKKLEEGMNMAGEARKRELLGACAYLAMSILYEFYLEENK